MALPPFTRRAINVTFQLGTGATVDQSGFNSIQFSGLRVDVHVQKAVLPHGGQGVISVYGLSLDHINQLTVAGTTWTNTGHNKIQIDAGDADSGFTTVFLGTIITAIPEFDQPDSPLVVNAIGVVDAQLTPIAPTSFPQPTAIGTILSRQAQSAGWTFENNGVNTTLASGYFPGTPWMQIKSAVRAADCVACFDDVTGNLAIWPKFGSRNSDPIVVSPATGMIGYPKFEKNRVIVRTLFDPDFRFKIGGQMMVQSQLAAANATWGLYSIEYALSSERPGGPWEMTLTGAIGDAGYGAQFPGQAGGTAPDGGLPPGSQPIVAPGQPF